MSAWDFIESNLAHYPVPVVLTEAEYKIVEEALASFVSSRLNEGSSWDLFEELSEAVTFSIPVKGLTDQQKEMIVKKFPELASQFKSGNTGHLLMLEPAVWQNIKKQITGDRALRGLGPAEELLTKIDGALELIQGRAATDKNRAQSPDFGKPGITPTVAKTTGLNDPSQSATVPRYTPPPASTSSSRPIGSTIREPEQELDPLEIDPDALARLRAQNGRSRVQAQDVASMQGAGKPKTTVLDPKDQEKTDDMEDPSTWGESVRLLNKLVNEAMLNEGRLSKLAWKVSRKLGMDPEMLYVLLTVGVLTAGIGGVIWSESGKEVAPGDEQKMSALTKQILNQSQQNTNRMLQQQALRNIRKSGR